jgi:riboflavin biosynthesis pyrimidine reductase
MTAPAVPEVTRPATPQPQARLVALVEDPVHAARDVRGEDMPAELAERYGGPLLIPLRTDRPTIVANFVSTLDGIVALGRGELAGGGLISGFHEPDRFVMGLLRAMADVVVVGAGTLRASGGHGWTAEHVHPASATAFAEWRASMGLVARPTTVIVTGSGDIPVDHRALTDPAIPVVIATTPAGAARLREAPLGGHVSVEAIGSTAALTGADVMAMRACLGARLILTEGGPHVLGDLVEADLLDELFLTLSPQLAGRAGDGRLGLVEGLGLPPADARWHELVSLHRSTDHLFLRYRRTASRAEES